ncbi:4Fe-4S cluster-binding domain-containing protein [Tissierella creatinophila]|uniref:Uncharacterized protein n=1 Tax=Tissierella creatinophila DSM 6911 TaxID=1123403 RepID=A0A1U7M3Z0_TISCR|nr:4Fe-4S cluster-binding domain-containing protein [Tissierella creatinophila]OLS02033.1 hypothetical protein TICRE_18500 [Tissierella creatinophila DSM 6911]
MYIKQGLFTDYLDIGHAIIIYNYFNNKVYKVHDPKKIEILHCIFKNYDIDELVNAHGNIFIDFLQELQLFNLVCITENKDVFHDDLSTGGCIAKFYSNNNKIEVRKLYVEIGNECDVNCNLCDNDAMFKCKSCFKIYKNENFDFDVLNNFISMTVEEYNCRELIFLGSEPLDDAKELLEISKNVKRINPNIKIYINTPFSISDKDILEDIYRNNIIINLQLVDNETYYDKINILLRNNIQIVPIIRETNDMNLIPGVCQASCRI